MIYSAEYTIKIKIDKLFMPPGHSEEELDEEVKNRGRENLKRYFNGVLFDPEKTIKFEEVSTELFNHDMIKKITLEIGKIYECFGTFVLCTGTEQIFGMVGQTFQGVVVETDGSEGFFLAQYSDTWSVEQFKETNKKIKLKKND